MAILDKYKNLEGLSNIPNYFGTPEKPVLPTPPTPPTTPQIPQPTKEVASTSSSTGLDIVKKAEKTQAAISSVPPSTTPTATPTTGVSSTLQTNRSTPPVSTSTLPTNNATPVPKVTYVNENGQSYTYEGEENIKANQANINALEGNGYHVAEYLNPPVAKTPDQITAEKSKADVDTLTAKLQTIDADLANDPALQGQLKNITAQWDQRIQEMQRSTESKTQGAQSAAYRYKGLQYGGGNYGTVAGVITGIEREGVSKVQDLMNQKNAALADAQQAYRTNKWNEYVQLINIADKKYSQVADSIKVLNTATMEKTKKDEEQRIRSSRDSAITDLMSQGLMDPTQILNLLNSNGQGNFTFDEINKITKEMKEVDKNQPGIVGEWLSAKANDPEFASIGLKQYMDIKNPGSALELENKRLQNAKLQKDLMPGASDEEFDLMSAYANQYASTGTVPAGLPKGSFGKVAQIAKELPKATGAVVNVITNVTDSKTPSTEQQDYSRLYNIIQNTAKLKDLDTKRWQGLISGGLGYVFGSDDQQNYETIRKAIVDDMSRMQSGAALTPDEVDYYSDYLPGRVGEWGLGFGADSQNTITQFDQFINNRLTERLSNNQLAIYGFSKVNVNGKDVVVGGIVEDEKGGKWKALPDGNLLKL